jgi:hypothetical protein
MSVTPHDGLIAVVKRDCPTCKLMVAVLGELAQRVGLRVYTQDDPSFPESVPGCIDDTELPPAQMKDATEKAKGAREGATKAVRLAWSHILFPIKTEATEAERAFELDQLTLASKDRAAIPAAVYDKVGPKGDNVAKEKLGLDTLWLNLKPLWPDNRSHLAITEVAEWFASYVYLPKLRDRVVCWKAPFGMASASSIPHSATPTATIRPPTRMSV